MGGSLTYTELLDVLHDKETFRAIKNFVETGTYVGRTVVNLSPHYSRLYTMEIVQSLHENAKKVAEMLGIDNITFLQGDSVKLLHTVMSSLNGEGTVFFLDAHQSGTDTSHNGMYVPLYDELDVILSYPVNQSVFIIDDVRLWKQGTWDWAHISTKRLLAKIGEKVSVQEHFEANDRLYIITK